MVASDRTDAVIVITVITLESEEAAAEVLHEATTVFGAHGIGARGETRFTPAIVGELAGFIDVIQAVGPAVGPSVAGAVAGTAVKELIDRLKKRGRKPHINAAAAEAIARQDIEQNLGVRDYEVTRRRTLPNCDEALTARQNCYILTFAESSGVSHTYVLTNDGEIASYDRDRA